MNEHTAENDALGTCPECCHTVTRNGCTGDPTPSDLWAGVSPAACDCPCPIPPEDGKHEVWCDGTTGCGMGGCADA